MTIISHAYIVLLYYIFQLFHETFRLKRNNYVPIYPLAHFSYYPQIIYIIRIRIHSHRRDVHSFIHSFIIHQFIHLCSRERVIPDEMRWKANRESAYKWIVRPRVGDFSLLWLFVTIPHDNEYSYYLNTYIQIHTHLNKSSICVPIIKLLLIDWSNFDKTFCVCSSEFTDGFE